MGGNYSFGTLAEIQFISKMISPQAERRTDLSPLEKLKRYRSAARRRKHWGSIDRREVFQFVDHQIDKFETFTNFGL